MGSSTVRRTKPARPPTSPGGPAGPWFWWSMPRAWAQPPPRWFKAWLPSIRAVEVAGVIFNRVGGEGHSGLLRRLSAPLGLDFLGCVPRDPGLVLPERHLGLVQAGEHADLEGFLGGRLRSSPAPSTESHPRGSPSPATLAPGNPRRRCHPWVRGFAVAQDQAFAFCYPFWLDSWRRQGAEVPASFRPWPTRRRGPMRTRSFCRAATRSFMPAASPATGVLPGRPARGGGAWRLRLRRMRRLHGAGRGPGGRRRRAPCDGRPAAARDLLCAAAAQPGFASWNSAVTCHSALRGISRPTLGSGQFAARARARRRRPRCRLFPLLPRPPHNLP